MELGKVGKSIEETINNKNFNSVSNLTGHSMDRWILHSGVSVPNIKEENTHIIHEGDVLAIEPFVTNGIGRVGDTNDAYIFRFLRGRPMRMVQAKKLLDTIATNYKTLPFIHIMSSKKKVTHELLKQNTQSLLSQMDVE